VTTPVPVGRDPASRWRGLLRLALILLIVVGVVVHVYVQVPIPPIIIFFVVFGVALYLLTREGRARTVGVVLGGVGAALFVLGNLPFVVEDLTHPDSGLAFFTSGAGIVGAVLGLVAMLGALMRWNERAVTPVGALGALAVVAVIGYGAVETVGVDSDEREPGDVALVAEDVDYFLEGEDPEREDDAQVTVERGAAVFVDNKDLYRHTFTVESLGIDEEIQAGVDQRVVINAEPGRYEFVCDVEGHEDDMKGTLIVG
jgi:hypothetical protein